MSKNNLFVIITISLIIFGCTKLDEPFRGDLTSGQVKADSGNATQLLLGVYTSMYRPFTTQSSIFPLMEFTTDEAIMPTRGGDWDDNGIWRALHQHKWLPNNEQIRAPFNDLNGISYAATDLLRYNPSPQQAAEARFIRAWAMYLLLDFFDQVPYRDPGESLVEPARVRQGMVALEYIIKEIDSIKPLLLSTANYRANQSAANFLLMKCYLNKHVYLGRPGLPATPQVEDMDKVISLADDIILNGGFTLSENYFDNFAPDNTMKGKENIFVLLNVPNTIQDNGTFMTWLMVLHYHQGFFCCNGGSTLSEFYDLFEAGDIRRGAVYRSVAGLPQNPGNHTNVGLLVGQQYDWFVDTLLDDRLGNLLNFRPEVHNIETDASRIEYSGIRPLKYLPDYQNAFSPDNDFVLFRFSDVLLMKAEAILRGGNATSSGIFGTSALELMNYIRTHKSRNASALTVANLDNLIDERGRELWWEGWRRQDMIRFGTFLEPFQEKRYVSEPYYLIFPIPEEQVALNKYLKQNPGY